jgi:hypothetical protein
MNVIAHNSKLQSPWWQSTMLVETTNQKQDLISFKHNQPKPWYREGQREPSYPNTSSTPTPSSSTSHVIGIPKSTIPLQDTPPISFVPLSTLVTSLFWPLTQRSYHTPLAALLTNTNYNDELRQTPTQLPIVCEHCFTFVDKWPLTNSSAIVQPRTAMFMWKLPPITNFNHKVIAQTLFQIEVTQ